MLINYPKFKININPKSKKVQGLKPGDVVRRQYFDGKETKYSLMYVLETGKDSVFDDETSTYMDSPYFIGGLIEGDHPRDGEILDFVRTTSMTENDRSGALYMTAVDSGAPYLSVIDGQGLGHSLSRPRAVYVNGIASLKEIYILEQEAQSQIFHVPTKTNRGDTISFQRKPNGVPATRDIVGAMLYNGCMIKRGTRLAISFFACADLGNSKSYNMCLTHGSRMDIETIWSFTVTKEMKDYFFIVELEDDSDVMSLLIHLQDLAPSNGLQIGGMNIVELPYLSTFTDSEKVRIGKLEGCTDMVYGQLKGYGAHVQNLYASGNVAISGTLTAGDENGFGSTFYAGRIYKNMVLDSINWLKLQTDSNITKSFINSPTGIGDVLECKTNSIPKISLSFEKEPNKHYTLSCWVRSAASENEPIFEIYNMGNRKVIYGTNDTWQRVHCVSSLDDSEVRFQTASGAKSGFFISSPQFEEGDHPTQYQPTDEKLSSNKKQYGAWFCQGGVGGTIQNPLLKFGDDGSIRAKNDSFIINNDGTGQFSGGKIKWDKTNVVFKDITLKWEDLDQASKDSFNQNLTPTIPDANLPDWVQEWDSNKTEINGNKLITPKIFAGRKETNGTLTGLALGANLGIPTMSQDNSITTKTINGLYGYNKGKNTWFFDTEGNAQIGEDNNFIKYDTATGKVLFGSDVSLNWSNLDYEGYVDVTDNYLQSTDFKQFTKKEDGTVTYPYITSFGVRLSNLLNFYLVANFEAATDLSFTNNYLGFSAWEVVSPASLKIYINQIEGQATELYIKFGKAGEIIKRTAKASSWSEIIVENYLGWKEDSYIYLGVNAPCKIWIRPYTMMLSNTPHVMPYKLSSRDIRQKTTKITSSGIYTGTLTAEQITAGTISADRIDAQSLQAKVVTADFIQSLIIKTNKGTIGGWNIDADSIYAGTKASVDATTNVTGITLWSDGANAAIMSKNFTIQKNGDVKINGSGTFSGTITASKGNIGSWKIESNAIKNDNVTLASDGSIKNNGGQWSLNNDGSGSLANGNISWKTDGTLKINASLTVSDLAATSGTIAGWKINNDAIFTGTKVTTNAYATDNGITIYSKDNLSAIRSQNFRIDTDGTAHFSGELEAATGSFTGEITAESGKIGGWVINTDHITKGDVYFGKHGDIYCNYSNTEYWRINNYGTAIFAQNKVRFNNDGSGWIANEKIKWDQDGSVTFDSSVKVNATVSADTINGLSLNFTRGKIGGWLIGTDSITGDKTILDSSGSITGNGWALNNDGSGKLANGNIAWNTNGSLTMKGFKSEDGTIGGFSISQSQLSQSQVCTLGPTTQFAPEFKNVPWGGLFIQGPYCYYLGTKEIYSIQDEGVVFRQPGSEWPYLGVRIDRGNGIWGWKEYSQDEKHNYANLILNRNAPNNVHTYITNFKADTPSDIRLKTVFYDVPDVLGKLENISAFYYTKKSDKDKILQIGVSAQAVKEVFPETVHLHTPEVEDSYYAVDYMQLITAVSINGIKELHAITKNLTSRIKELEYKLASLSPTTN